MNPRNRIWCSDLSMNQGEQNSFLTWIPLHLFLAVLVSLFHYFSFVSKKSFIFYCLRILRVWGETAVLGCRGSGWILSSQTCLVMTLSKLLCLSRLQCPSPPPTLSTHTHTHTLNQLGDSHVVAAWKVVPACITLKFLASSGLQALSSLSSLNPSVSMIC